MANAVSMQRTLVLKFQRASFIDTTSSFMYSYHFVDKTPEQMAAQVATHGPISIAADASLVSSLP